MMFSGMIYLMLGILLVFTIFAMAVILLWKRKGGNDNDGDGGIEPWQRPPRLDLPPGVCWPTDGHDNPRRREVEEELVL